jgi:hypothetical protein
VHFVDLGHHAARANLVQFWQHASRLPVPRPCWARPTLPAPLFLPLRQRAARKPTINLGENPARLVLFLLGEHPARRLDVKRMDQPARGHTIKLSEQTAREPSGEVREDATGSA